MKGPTKAELAAEVAALREQQTATSEILRTISQSQTDVQPVFETIVASGLRLSAGYYCALSRYDGEAFHLAALTGSTTPSALEAFRRIYPIPLSQAGLLGIAVRERSPVQSADVFADPRVGPYARELAQAQGSRSLLHVPLIHGGVAIGTLSVTKREAGEFADALVALLQTFAEQAVIAIENARLFTELGARNRELAETLERETATGDILRVISSSPTDVQPVLEAMAESATRLCGAYDAAVFRLEGENLRLMAHHGVISAPPGLLVPAIRGTVGGRTVVDRQAIQVADLQAEAEEFPEGSRFARELGHRTVLSVPLLRESIVIGVIQLRRREARLFTDKEIELLKTFADQAVIAIENARLFTELQASNRDLTESLDRQMATAEILRVISGSPTDVQPVFDSVVDSAARLCGANEVILLLVRDGVLRIAAGLGSIVRSAPPDFHVPLVRGSVAARAAVDHTIVHVEDLASAPEDEFAEGRKLHVQFGHRTSLAVPLLREGASLGVIFATRFEVRAFTDQEITLLQTFADQAVIAIENARLFTELQVRNRDLTEALDTQTATGEILRVISRSPTDVQPVFEAIVRNAVRLCGALYGTVYRCEGELIHFVAQHNFTSDQMEEWRRTFPRHVSDRGPVAHVLRTRAALCMADIEGDIEVEIRPEALANMRARGVRSLLNVPMFRGGEVIGMIAVTHAAPHAFSEAHVALLQTFAAQAVIAVENARLFTELQARTAELTRSVGELTALGEVGRALGSTLDLETVLQTIVVRANELAGTAGCTIWEYDEAREEFGLRASDYADEDDAALLQGASRVTAIPRGLGVMTLVMERRQPVQIHDIAVEGAEENPIRRRLIDAGHHGLLAVPLLREDEVIGVLTVTRKIPGEFEPEVVQLLTTFATQSTLAIQNARLFRELEEKGRQLEAASQHKSEFLANMSHELRTPLNAIIGFSEVLAERMFGEINDKQAEYVGDILESGRHLLSLINDILDLSKIEAGRMELEPGQFDLPTAIDNALVLVRERAGRRGIALERTIDGRLGLVHGDERKVKQVLLNLLSNALKFTPEGGRIDVRAGVNDGMAEISVADTGVGIAPGDQEAIFEEFRQVGTASKKVEGTGLGLALSRRFVELHGGRIRVKSAPGAGSTFTFTLPLAPAGRTATPPA